MNKKFTEFFNAYGMTITGNNAYGVVKGYETNAIVAMMDNVTPLRLHISFYATDEQKRAIEAAIRNAQIKYLNFRFTPYGILIGLNDITVKKLITRLPQLLDTFYGILAENGGLGSEYCPVCGNVLEPFAEQKRNIEGFTITLDGNCVENINAVISAENKDFNEAPNNYLKGFLGALIGGLAGAAVSVAFYMAGFVSSISAIISVMLGAFLYQKFHGKPNKMMIVIVSVTTIVCMIASILGIYIVAAGLAADQEGIEMNAFDAFAKCMQNGEFAGWFYGDLALSLVFSAIGVGLEIFTLKNKIKRQQNI